MRIIQKKKIDNFLNSKQNKKLFLKLKSQLEKSAILEDEFAKSEKARVKAQAEVTGKD